MASKQLLEEQIGSLEEEINVLSNYIDSLNESEQELEDRITELQTEYDDYYEKYRERVRENYEKGDISYWKTSRFGKFFRYAHSFGLRYGRNGI